MSAQRTISWSPRSSQSLTTACSSPPTYCTGLETCGSSGSSRSQTLSTGTAPRLRRVFRVSPRAPPTPRSGGGRLRRHCARVSDLRGLRSRDMSDVRELFDRAQGHFGELVHQVKDDQWGNDTPCTDWDVRALVNHLVYEARWAVPLLEGQTIEQVGDRFEGDLLGGAPAAAYDDALGQAKAAVGTSGALEGTVHLSFGDTPADEYLAQLTSDYLVHSWDLARGIDADDALDPELVEFVYAKAEPVTDMLGASGLFAPPVDVGAASDPQTRLLALFGRKR